LHKEMSPGDVRGFDVRTGQHLGTFRTVPHAGEVGDETWENESWNHTGGTNVWSIMSADEGLGHVHLPVSTPANDYYGAEAARGAAPGTGQDLDREHPDQHGLSRLPDADPGGKMGLELGPGTRDALGASPGPVDPVQGRACGKDPQRCRVMRQSNVDAGPGG
jgi:hypothetical protein